MQGKRGKEAMGKRADKRLASGVRVEMLKYKLRKGGFEDLARNRAHTPKGEIKIRPADETGPGRSGS